MLSYCHQNSQGKAIMYWHQWLLPHGACMFVTKWMKVGAHIVIPTITIGTTTTMIITKTIATSTTTTTTLTPVVGGAVLTFISHFNARFQVIFLQTCSTKESHALFPMLGQIHSGSTSNWYTVAPTSVPKNKRSLLYISLTLHSLTGIPDKHAFKLPKPRLLTLRNKISHDFVLDSLSTSVYGCEICIYV